MTQFIQQLQQKFHNFVWQTYFKHAPWWKRFLIRSIRILIAVFQDIANGSINLRAMSLVYTTIISLVPLLALSFSVLKGFGVHNQIEPALLEAFEPLGEKRGEIIQKIIEFVENIEIKVLGAIGLGILVYTVISMMQKIENSFNDIWRISRGRNVAQKFSDYLSVIMVGPFLIFVSVGLTASIKSNTVVEYLSQISIIGNLLEFSGLLMPYFIMAFAFAFMYVYIPNTKVSFRSALLGGFITAVTWKSMGWIFAQFLANSSNQVAIYSAFASVFMFMLWLYLGWLVLLIGASITYYHQYPQHISVDQNKLKLSNQAKEKLGLTIMYYIGDAFENETPAWDLQRFIDKLQFPSKFIEAQIETLEQAGLITQIDSTPTSYHPGRPLEKIKINELLNILRSSSNSETISLERVSSVGSVSQLLKNYQQNIDQHFSSFSLKDLLANKELIR